jgi:hypothetical protein
MEQALKKYKAAKEAYDASLQQEEEKLGARKKEINEGYSKYCDLKSQLQKEINAEETKRKDISTELWHSRSVKEVHEQVLLFKRCVECIPEDMFDVEIGVRTGVGIIFGHILKDRYYGRNEHSARSSHAREDMKFLEKYPSHYLIVTEDLMNILKNKEIPVEDRKKQVIAMCDKFLNL